jgi:hypothetical protein
MTQRTLITVSYNKTITDSYRLTEIEGLDNIHKVISRKNPTLLDNRINEIFIVI